LTDLTLRGDDMVEIAESNLHDIDDLVEKWKAGWRELAKFGNQICPTVNGRVKTSQRCAG